MLMNSKKRVSTKFETSTCNNNKNENETNFDNDSYYYLKKENFETKHKTITQKTTTTTTTTTKNTGTSVDRNMIVNKKKIGVVKPYQLTGASGEKKLFTTITEESSNTSNSKLNDEIIDKLKLINSNLSSDASSSISSSKEKLIEITNATTTRGLTNDIEMDLRDDDVIAEDEDVGIDDVESVLFIERMQTISISKNKDNERRKSVHQMNNVEIVKRQSNQWNYDELNELRMKFISLLSNNTPTKSINSSDRVNTMSKSLTDEYSKQILSDNEFAVKHVALSGEQVKRVESFYSSIGTQLFVSTSQVSLYALTVNEEHTKATFDKILNLFMTNEAEISTQDWSVTHHGVPLWLFNTGANPRRPYRQLKFTLAENGTGFILWQDRIDARSEFRVFRKKRNDNLTSTPNYTLYDSSQIGQTADSSSFLISFKASDRKTLVFLKFEINSEVLKFFDYYLKIHRKICEEIKQRTKSLPIGVGTEIMSKNLKQKSIVYAGTKQIKTIENPKPHEISNIFIVKYRRITKDEISRPSSMKHHVHLKYSDRNAFYTLSKLLPNRNVEHQINKNTQRHSQDSTSLSLSLSSTSSITDRIELGTHGPSKLVGINIESKNRHMSKTKTIK